MATKQPVWKLLCNLGDANPIDYGGYFVYLDETGVYPPEAELLLSPDSDESAEGWTIYRFILDRCTFTNGVLSDNSFHPDYPAWFAEPEARRAERPQDTTYLRNVAECCGIAEDDMIRMLCSADPIDRAEAYRAIGEYHGFENLDAYPLHFATRAEVEARYPDQR